VARRRIKLPGWATSAVTGGCLVLISAWGLAASSDNALLLNTTPSEPEGLYWRINVSAARGQLIAFLAPATAFPYADARLSVLHQTPILKMVGAGPGEPVCSDGRTLALNGRRYAVQNHDSAGGILPHWIGCRSMASDEYFVFSDRVPNSFDSRYFGPISRAAIIGVYRPLFTK
jgi:conjugative transfer signal peptidase TraF